MKHAFRLSRARAALVALAAAAVLTAAAQAQTLSSAPDTAIFQITSTTPTPAASATPTPSPTPSPTPATSVPIQRDSFAGDVSGSGRFVVIESSGDIATNRVPDVRDASGNVITRGRNNEDGNQEIFLFDYAQRRIYQITDTRSALKDATRSPLDATNIDVVVVNLQPSISHDGKYIVFQSNAYVDANPSLSPAQFDGQPNAAALKADGNTEIFIYALPAFTEVADLSQGAEVPEVNLANGTMRRVTATPATAPPRPASGSNIPAFFALDNYDPVVNDDGTLVTFVSKARSGSIGTGNADGNKEIFLVRNPALPSRTFTQVTTTADVPGDTPLIPKRFVFNESPSLSACVGDIACRLAYISNADAGSSEAEADRGNGEIFVATLTLSDAAVAVQGTTQLTKTPPETRVLIAGASVNILSPGRRIARDGSRVVFESSAPFTETGGLGGALAGSFGIYIVNVSGTPAFQQVGQRPPSDQLDLPTRWPTFTGDSSRVVWASNLNYNADGTVSTTTGTGLNQSNLAQVFSAPVLALTTVSRVTNLGVGVGVAQHGPFSAIQPFPADDVRRMALSLRSEQGSGNSDASSEAFYQLIPLQPATPAPSPSPSPDPVSFFTGASDRAVVAPSPSPTPPDVPGLAPGMLAIARSTLVLAPTTVEIDKGTADEFKRRPPLPVELAGVSVTVAGAASGLYFVSPGRLSFVVPKGLATPATPVPVVVFNNGTLYRTSLQLNFAQPDIFSTTNGPGGRAIALNVTDMCVQGTAEPFAVVSSRPANNDCAATTRENVATRLLFLVTGMRGVTAPATVTVRIGTTDIVGTADPATSPVAISPTNTPGFDQVTVTLPPSLEHAGDVPVVITVAATAGTFTSRPAETAPRITIQ
ncbi:MAG TPA: hypothetical protein VF591_18790 [Pyrinomonadaceae bacterium]